MGMSVGLIKGGEGGEEGVLCDSGTSVVGVMDVVVVSVGVRNWVGREIRIWGRYMRCRFRTRNKDQEKGETSFYHMMMSPLNKAILFTCMTARDSVYDSKRFEKGG
ncbi:hypothetical protein E3N88_15811 [Mikania micrantha]|uniref:Uncharacterized protein n=1 Tax=Mikania micrantha TaxID=192012 RepID=A0A5N6NYA5_9ASTR|nr:hypothetical protein E3N88_15811 [Mikania micrantha]